MRRFGLLARSLLFTTGLHAALIALLVYSVNWSQPAPRGAPPLQAVAIIEAPPPPPPARDQQAEEAEQQRLEQQRKRRQEAERRARIKSACAELVREEEAAGKVNPALDGICDEERDALLEQRRAEAAERKRAEAAELKRQEEERRREEAAERKRQEEERQRAEAAELKRQEEERQRIEEARRAAELTLELEKEQAQQAQIRNEAGDALGALVDRIAEAVADNWSVPQTSRRGLTATIRVRVARDGRVTSARITHGSGDRFFDESAENAVRKASPLPFPTNPEYYEFIKEFDFKFNPDDF